MQALGYTRPTRIQTLAFRSILDGKSCIIADQTGSGKTLSYLVPTLQLTREELNDLALPSREPIVVVVTPTTELACQVAKVAKSLAHTLKFRTACVTALSEMDSEQRKLRLGVELLIATPGSLLRLLKRGEVSLKRTRTIVLDEADALFLDETFPLQPIGAACGSQTQFVFVTATLPEKAYDQIRREFPEAVEIKGPGLHKISPKIEEVLVDCSGPRDQPKSVETSFQNKQEALLEAIDRYPSDRTLVFCNCIEQCRKVENALLRADRQLNRYVVLPCHGAIETMKRKANLERFAGPLEEDWSGTDRFSTAWRRQRDERTSSSCGLPMIMVCTDRAARGIDFDKSPVEHVVLFDFPAEPAEYVRRVGRTGRAGRFGKVTVLAVGPQVPLARQVMAASKAGRPIE